MDDLHIRTLAIVWGFFLGSENLYNIEALTEYFQYTFGTVSTCTTCMLTLAIVCFLFFFLGYCICCNKRPRCDFLKKREGGHIYSGQFKKKLFGKLKNQLAINDL